MRVGSVLTFVVAAVLAVTAGILAQMWLEQQRRAAQPSLAQPTSHIGHVVVAAQALRFGTELTGANAREIEWPMNAIPAGAFTSMSELVGAAQRRVVLSPIEANEPILRAKITGPGQRASLSAVIEPDMKAVTIRVNDVFGVAGFVLPGDRVDILHTRSDPNGEDGFKHSYTDVLLQNVRVLGIDQLADERTDRPTLAKAVTLEVDTLSAQKLTLAGSLGSLSLALRPAGAVGQGAAQRLMATGLSVAPAEKGPVIPVHRNGNVAVTRAVIRSEYTVPISNYAGE